ncbi:protein of unknown function [Chishuiella changwenlii]|uniref:DUF4249 domain-containing protein n=1 Tax=Chishuiella changwenlii TaxID=1434701 RepID=A0A1M6YRX8_9FLAO|nr:DUF4249 domain-containing protein [Chishuiella changwenlii]GGE88410.1 hypothetical protein GCM10010984_02690 [Chishuiella changwenlii]SHL21036.1 protein of unknown function [Chishuiella changwenlii]
MKKILAIIPLLLLFISCEKEIELDLKNTTPQIVVEGAITDAEGPYFVKLSKSINFYDPNKFPAVTGASVIITDNLGNSDVLTELEDGLYRTNNIVGFPGNTYNLSITVGEDKYYATSTMPQKVNLDSIRFEHGQDTEGEDYYSIIPIYKNPSTFGNYYRFVTKINNRTDDTYYLKNDTNGIDQINDSPIYNLDYTYINKNDLVEVEMRCIDRITYNYFNTILQVINAGPNGGITPTNPPNNITGSPALGIFSAYTTQTIKQKVE